MKCEFNEAVLNQRVNIHMVICSSEEIEKYMEYYNNTTNPVYLNTVTPNEKLTLRLLDSYLYLG